MNRRNFLKYTTVGATLPLTAKAAWLSQPVPNKHLVVYIELFGKRWPAPVELISEDGVYNLKALADMTFNIQTSVTVPQHIPVFLPTEVKQRLPEGIPDYIFLETDVPQDIYCSAGETLLLSFDNRGLGFIRRNC